MNSNLLKAYMKMNDDTLASLSDALGISMSNLCDKINGKSASFRQTEIMAIKKRYGLTAEDVNSIFFVE